ncbi:hypothetical protein [Planomonospora sp. ID82291]|uniref:hypothetical protein n=1 Tax=Planomonospora sp. ID82291 TaxID=2738136 RepID=UPI0018C3D7A2|nr:hypothetical protein [Planomonospora sp. ID82291]MBG0818440.1 hypothetical protein [Planomonospora sp. ID82291]
MTNIAINQTCGDGNSAEPVTVTVSCTCTPGTPGPATDRLAEAALHGFAAATVLPQYCDRAVKHTGPLVIGATAILPAGASIAAVGVAVAAPGDGETGTDSRVAVYIGGIAEKAGQSLHKATLYTAAGWRWANLEQPVTAADDDRIVWLVAQVPNFTGTPPSILAAGQPGEPGMLNGLRYRSVIVNGLEELPLIFDGDAIPFSGRLEVPALAASSVPVSQP